MLRKLLVVGVSSAVGYLVGMVFGYRAAVVDYVENDAQTIESMAETMYPTRAEGEQLPEGIREVVEQAKEQDSDEQGASNDGSKGFR